MTINIPLSGRNGHGQFALVDDIDADLAQYKWHLLKIGYAARSEGGGNKPKKHFHLHRVIMSRQAGRTLKRKEVVDHIDRNKLNNCRNNLRLATQQQNTFNAGIRSNNQTGFIGVTKVKRLNLWKMQIKTGCQILSEHFSTPEEAARAYDAAARKYKGEFAGQLNFPNEFHKLEDLLTPGMFRHNKSGFRGVHFSQALKKWYAQIKVDGKGIHLGRFDTPEEAAKLYDAAALHYFGKDAYFNFPGQIESLASLKTFGLWASNTSGFRGVWFDKRRFRWVAEITVNYKKKSLGRFDTPEEAACAYDRAARQYFGPNTYLNFPDETD